MSRLSAGAYKRLFPQHHIPLILLLVIQAGEKVRKLTVTDREDRITIRLYRQLIREPSFRDGPLQIHLQPEIVSSDVDPEKETPEGWLDLQVSCGHGNEVYFAIEAKRLRVTLPRGLFLGGREYVKDGMMRFVTGQYAPFMQAGAMLGYVYDGKVEITRSDIILQIQKRTEPLKLKDPKRLAPSHVLPGQPVDETTHNINNRSFTIYHLLLAV
ncbi:MAG: hypothetical protein KKF30_18730 [Proteobacteria bacterium]|nr:hypothetical protein [Pseudomonadota bacterium]MBU4470883.1 hypothetical protein [Pseudomonadota bacterium]MCG2751881.1 hypothetical protein [Desulfobacteraceae bacterium]